jgi:hypothetical protein
MSNETKVEESSVMEDFFTRENANAGIRLPLFSPRTGKETAHWLHILGRDSDAFHREESDSHDRFREGLKKIMEDPTIKPTDREERIREISRGETLRCLASLVSAWSFPQECTREAVVAFLREAPQIKDHIDEVATKRTLFSKSVANASPATPNPSSGSVESPTEASRPSEPV